MKYKCVNCKKTTTPMLGLCQHCNYPQPAIDRMKAVKDSFAARTIEIRNIPCDECKCETSFFMTDNTLNYDEFACCTQCNHITYRGKQYISHSTHSKPTVTCPYCKSTNTKKISSLSKAGSVAMWGIFALGKTTKQWHCNDCKSDF